MVLPFKKKKRKKGKQSSKIESKCLLTIFCDVFMTKFRFSKILYLLGILIGNKFLLFWIFSHFLCFFAFSPDQRLSFSLRCASGPSLLRLRP